MICQVSSEMIVREMEQLALATSPRKAPTCEEQLGEEYFLSQLLRLLPADLQDQGASTLDVLQGAIDYINALNSVLGDK